MYELREGEKLTPLQPYLQSFLNAPFLPLKYKWFGRPTYSLFTELLFSFRSVESAREEADFHFL